MLVAGVTVHRPFGFLNWSGAQKGEGFEHQLLALAMTTLHMIRGAGALAIDRALATRPQRRATEPGLARS